MSKEVSIEQLKEELSMLVGQSSNDLTYLYYLLVKEGTYFKKEPEPIVISSPLTVSTFEDWFNSL